MATESFGPIANGALAELVPSVRVAKSAADLAAAAWLRYQVYVVEQKKAYPEANHSKRLLTDELDEESSTVLVTLDGEAVGTVRANWLPSERLESRYGRVCEFHHFSNFPPAAISVCSRLAVSSSFRDSRARGLLFEAIYTIGLERSTRLCFATCAKRLLRLFRSYGFREYGSPVFDAAAGELHRTLLVLDDLKHLARIGSPFREIAAERGVSHTDRPWLDELFTEYGNLVL